jgi:hypothetical protein
MRWLKPNLRSSLWALFGAAPAEPVVSTIIERVTVEDIRAQMQQLAESVAGERSEQVMRRIRYASDVEALWFIRSELMALLAGSRGEAAALEAIDAISDMFENLLPEGLRSRPSPLSASLRDVGR